MIIPWPHPRRAEVLAALALAARRREPLADGLARLAEADPLLQAWHRRLAPDLGSGVPLAEVLFRHRLLDRRAAAVLAEEADPAAALDRAASGAVAGPHNLWLIRWFPVALTLAVLVPLVAVQLTGIFAVFATVFRDLNIRLPGVTAHLLDASYLALLLPPTGAVATWIILQMLAQIRGLRHLRHLWWVEVHRQAAMLRLVEAALAGHDAPVHLRWPLSWLAWLRLTALRQDRPAWDEDWRTWRILTRWRALGHGWREAARAGTAAGVLRALGLLPAGGSTEDLRQLHATVAQRLRHALEPACIEARALLMVAIGIGVAASLFAMFLPLIMVVEQLNSGGF